MTPKRLEPPLAVPDLVKGLLVPIKRPKRSLKSPEVWITSPESLFAPSVVSSVVRRKRSEAEVKYSPIKSGGTTPLVTIHRKKRRSSCQDENKHSQPAVKPAVAATPAVTGSINRKKKKKPKLKETKNSLEVPEVTTRRSPAFGCSDNSRGRTSISDANPGIWSEEELAYLKNLVDTRTTLTIQWEQIALGMSWKRPDATAEECEEAYFDLVSQEYSKSTKKPAKRSGAVTPAEGFNARDPTRKFKMTQMLAERNFMDQPNSLISSATAKQFIRRYSFLNDSFSKDLAPDPSEDTPQKSASLLDDALPQRKQNNWKLDDDRFLQKLKGAAKKASNSRDPSTVKPAASTKTRIKSGGAAFDKILGEALVATDAANNQCITASGLQEELIALSNRKEEQELINQEMSVVEDATSLIT